MVKTMKIILMGSFTDMQTGVYIGDTFTSMKHDIYGIDIRRIYKTVGAEKTQETVIKELIKLNLKPDLILILKGLELSPKTIRAIKDMYPKAIYANWFFDKFLQEEPIWKTESYLKIIKEFDYFFCSLKGVADKLNDLGYKNVKYLDEGCEPKRHSEIYLNNFQKKKYASDVSFIGNIGYLLQHHLRLPMLKIIAEEGFRLQIFGSLCCDIKHVPTKVRPCLTQIPVINEDHSKVVQSSLINLGIDQDLGIDMGHSARVYRVLCAGGCYLTTNTKGLDKMFKTNKKDDDLTGEEEIVIFDNKEDLIKKLDFLLEHDDIREQIGKNGQKKVLKYHTFKHRCEEMLKIIKGEKNERGDKRWTKK